MSSTSNNFNQSAPEPNIMEPKEYYELCKKLATQGFGQGKADNVGAFKLQNIIVDTEDDNGDLETRRTVDVSMPGKKAPESAYLLMELDKYTTEDVREAVMLELAEKWGKKNIKARDLDSPDFKGPGIWLNIESKVTTDYLEPDSGSVWVPNQEETRICIDTNKPIKIPVQWDGGFFVDAKGTIAIRQRDFNDLVNALQDIDQGKATIEDALYDASGNAKIDIYGMKPGFRADAYDDVELKDDAKKLQASYVSSLTSNGSTTNTPKP